MKAQPQAGARGEHQDRVGARAANPLRLADAPHVAVVADGQRHRPPGALGERAGVGRVNVEPLEARRQVRRSVPDAVALEGAGDRQADPLHLVPDEPVLVEVSGDRLDPVANDRLGPLAGAGRPLEQPGRDGGAVVPDAPDLRRRGAAVGTEINGPVHLHRVTLDSSTDYPVVAPTDQIKSDGLILRKRRAAVAGLGGRVARSFRKKPRLRFYRIPMAIGEECQETARNGNAASLRLP